MSAINNDLVEAADMTNRKGAPIFILVLMLLGSIPAGLFPGASASMAAGAEGWDNPTALTSWTISGAAATSDCVTTFQGCTLKLTPTGVGVPLTVSKQLSGFEVGAAPWYVTTYFRASGASPNLYYDFRVATDIGFFGINFTAGPSHNQIVVFTQDEISAPFATLSGSGWYNVNMSLDAVAHTLRARVTDSNGNVVGNSDALDPPIDDLIMPIQDGGPGEPTTAASMAENPIAGRLRAVTFGGYLAAAGNPVTNPTMNFDTLKFLIATEPKAPTVSATGGPNVGDVTLSWSPPLDDGGALVNKYSIFAGSTPGSETFLTNVSATTRSYTESGLAIGAWRYYRVSAWNNAGQSPQSAEVGAHAFTLAGAPRDPSAIAGTGVGQVKLSWRVPADIGGSGATLSSYQIYRGTDPASLSLLTQVGPSVLTYTDQHLTNGTNYHYRVTALNNVGEGPASATVQSLPRPDAASSPAGLLVTPDPGWTGQTRRASFSYSVTASECPLAATCPVEHEWRVYLDGSASGADGILLASGRANHSGHAESATFPVVANVTPTGDDGVHRVKVAVNTRVGSTQWWTSSTNIQIGLPQPELLCSADPAYYTYLAPNVGWLNSSARNYAKTFAYKLDGVVSPYRAKFQDGCKAGSAPGGGDGAFEMGYGGILLDATVAPAGTTLQVVDSTGQPVWFVIGSDVDNSGVIGDAVTDCLTGPHRAQSIIKVGCAPDSSGKYVVVITPSTGATPVWGRIRTCLTQVTTDPCLDITTPPRPDGTINPPFQPDANANGLGDGWETVANLNAGGLASVGPATADQEYAQACSASCGTAATPGDGLTNGLEYRWRTTPIGPVNVCTEGVCSLAHANSRDFDQDNWIDSEEVAYWNDPANDAYLASSNWAAFGIAPLDPDSALTFSAGGPGTVHNPDNDGDGLKDGDEIKLVHSYPEYPDSDCVVGSQVCQQPGTTRFATHLGQPGTGDGIRDGPEFLYWAAISSTAATTDIDGDQLSSALLDPDADGDTLLDGAEIPLALGGTCALKCTSAGDVDTDADRLLDGPNLQLAATDPRVNIFLEKRIFHDDNAQGYLFYGEATLGSDPSAADVNVLGTLLGRPPSAPRDPAVGPGTAAGSLDLAWLAPSDHGGLSIVAYRVYAGVAPTNLTLRGTTPLKNYTDGGLRANTTYYYQIAAWNGAAEGARTAIVSATTPVRPPQAPTIINATGGPAENEITISWDPPSDDGGLPVLGYRIYQGVLATDLELIDETASLTFTSTDLPANVPFMFRVSAVNDAGEGEPSAIATAAAFSCAYRWGNELPGEELEAREHNDEYDASFLMWCDPYTSWGERVYLDAIMLQTGAGDLSSAVSSALGASYQMFAFYGLWKDCNNDGYIGSFITASVEYSSVELFDTRICPPLSGSDPNNPWKSHNYNGWVREFLWFVPANYQNQYSASEIVIPHSKVWTDFGAPWDPYDPFNSMIFPLPEGTTHDIETTFEFADYVSGGTITTALRKTCTNEVDACLAEPDIPPEADEHYQRAVRHLLTVWDREANPHQDDSTARYRDLGIEGNCDQFPDPNQEIEALRDDPSSPTNPFGVFWPYVHFMDDVSSVNRTARECADWIANETLAFCRDCVGLDLMQSNDFDNRSGIAIERRSNYKDRPDLVLHYRSAGMMTDVSGFAVPPAGALLDPSRPTNAAYCMQGFCNGWYSSSFFLAAPQIDNGMNGEYLTPSIAPTGSARITTYAGGFDWFGWGWPLNSILSQGWQVPSGGWPMWYGSPQCGSSSWGQMNGWKCDPWEWACDLDWSGCLDGRTPWDPRVDEPYWVRDVDSLSYATTPPIVEFDQNQDGVGDNWIEPYLGLIRDILVDDFDLPHPDGATLIEEFRWKTNPLDADTDDDNWEDGPESDYWNATPDQAYFDTALAAGVAVNDTDAENNIDQDEHPTTGLPRYNQHDPDSDNDGALDGNEIAHGTYPEFVNSDCDTNADTCRASRDSRYRDVQADRPTGQVNDLVNDEEEYELWESQVGSLSWTLNYDADHIANALLDPDSDDDGLLDGNEFHCPTTSCGSPGAYDTDHDGLLDGPDVTVDTGTPRDQMFGNARIARTYSNFGQVTYHGETGRLTDPRDWDTDNDGMPDGWEFTYGLQPAANIEGDSDGDGMSDVSEYRWVRPSWWVESRDGAWWYGTYPNDDDSDDDGASDGEEVSHGTNPLDGQSTWPGYTSTDASGPFWSLAYGVSNENLDAGLMDPTNLYYLNNGVVHDAAEAAGLTTIIDQGIVAEIVGTVTEALVTAYDTVLAGPPIEEPLSTVDGVVEPLVGMIDCTTSALPPPEGITADPTVLLGVSIEGELQDVSTCVNEALTPILDPLLGQALSQVNGVTQVTQTLDDLGLPATVDGVLALVPPVISATARGLLGDPVGTIGTTIIDVQGLLAAPGSATQLLPLPQGTQDVPFLPVVAPTNRHPTFTYDLLHQEGLDVLWPVIVQAEQAAGPVDPLATIDSLSFNVYTKRNGVERVKRVNTSETGCIVLDESTVTRDAEGCDMYATFTVSTEIIPPAQGHPMGMRVTPTVELTAAVPNARFDVTAIGYLQVPDAPYIMVLGFDTTGAGAGLPNEWTGTIHGFDTRELDDREFSVTTTYDDPRPTVPLHIVAGAFKVNMTVSTKPVIPGNTTALEIASAGLPSELAYTFTRLEGAGAAPDSMRATATVETDRPSTLRLVFSDVVANKQADLELDDATLEGGTTQWTHRATDLTNAALTWTTPGPGISGGLLRYQEKGGSRRVSAAEIDGLPASFALALDTVQHAHAVDITPAGSPLGILLSEGDDSCMSYAGRATRSLVVELTSTRLCAAGDLDGHASLDLSATLDTFSASATGDGLGDAAYLMTDGPVGYVKIGSDPGDWSVTYQKLANADRTIHWSGQMTTDVTLDVALAGGAERGRVDIVGAPPTYDVTFSPTQEKVTADGSADASRLSGFLSNTGFAPTLPRAEGGDYLRVKRPTGDSAQDPPVEVALSLRQANDVVAQVKPDDSLEISANYASAHGLETRYAKNGYNIAVVTASLLGSSTITVQPGPAPGKMETRWALGGPTSSVSIVGTTPSGSVAVDASGLLAGLTRITADPVAQSFEIESPGAIGVEFRSSTGDAPVDALALGNFILLSDEGTKSAHARFAAASGVALQRTTGAVTFTANPASSSALAIRTADPTTTVALSLDRTPASLSIVEAAGSFSLVTSAGRDVRYALNDAGAGRNLLVYGTDLAATLDLTWATGDGGAFTSHLTHDGTTIPYLYAEESIAPPTGASETMRGTYWQAQEAAADVQVDMAPAASSASLTSRDGSGALAASGRVQVAFNVGSSSVPTAPSDAIDHVRLKRTVTTQTGYLGARSVERIDVALTPTAQTASPQARVELQRDGARDILVESDDQTSGTTTRVSLATAVGDTKFVLDTLTTGVDGFHTNLTTQADAGALDVFVTKGARTIDLDVASTPKEHDATWSVGLPLEIHSRSPSTTSVKYASGGAEVPDDPVNDFVALSNDGQGTIEFGARLTGIREAVVDPLGGALTILTGGTVAPLRVDYVDVTARVNLRTSTQARLEVTWSPTQREVHVETSGGLPLFELEVRPTSDHATRMQLRASALASGRTSFLENVDGQFEFTSPGAGHLLVAIDEGGATPLQALETQGVYSQAGAQGKPLSINLWSVKRVSTLRELGAAPSLVIERTQSTGGEATFRLDNPDANLVATASRLAAGTTTFEWPATPTQGSTSTAVVFRAQAAASGAEHMMSIVVPGQDHAEARVTNSPATWTVSFAADGTTRFAGTSSASRVRLDAAWLGGAIALDASSVPSFDFLPAGGLQEASLSAGTSTIGAIDLRLAASSGTGSAGQVPSVTTPATDLVALDTSTNGGLLVLLQHSLTDLAWNLPLAGSALGADSIEFSLHRAGSGSGTAYVQLVHPDHQTSLSMPSGEPQTLFSRFTPTTSSWTLEQAALGKVLDHEHQDSRGGVVKTHLAAPTAPVTFSVSPKTDANGLTARYSSSAGAAAFDIDTRWDGAFFGARTTGLPSVVELRAGGTQLREGHLDTQGGQLGTVDLLLVPGSTTVVRRLNPQLDQLNVVANTDNPYLALKTRQLTNAHWDLPASGTNEQVVFGLARATPHGDDTYIVLGGPADNITARLQGTPAVSNFEVVPSTNGQGTPLSSIVPWELIFAPVSAPASAVTSLTHVHLATGQVATIKLTGATAPTTFEATGSEPVAMDLTTSAPPQGLVFATTDGGTYLKLDVAGPTPTYSVDVHRGDCGQTEPFTVHMTSAGTGTPGPVSVLIGDEGKTPPPSLGTHSDIRCQGGSFGMSARLPAVPDVLQSLSPLPCIDLDVKVFGKSGSPAPFAFVTQESIIRTKLQTRASAGVMDLHLGCDPAALSYELRDLGGSFTKADFLDFGYESLRHATGSNVVADCMEIQASCVNWLNLTGHEMGAKASATFGWPNDVKGLKLEGDASKDAVITILTDPGPKPDETHLKVQSTMTIEALEFLLTDKPEQAVGGEANRIILYDDASQRTSYLKLTKIDKVSFALDSKDDPFELAAHLDYEGRTTAPLELYMVSEECVRKKLTASNVPTQLTLDISVRELLFNIPTIALEVTRQSQAIGELRFTSRFGGSCGDPDKGVDFFANAVGIPAGPWNLGESLGSAGWFGLSARVARLDAGIASPTNTNRYVSLHADNPRFYFEWDLDGDTRYANNPRYVYCDTESANSKWTVRARFDDFGIGFRPGTDAADIACQDLQVKWYFGELPFNIPSFKRSGQLVWSVKVPVVEILVFNNWWSTPDKLWTTAD